MSAAESLSKQKPRSRGHHVAQTGRCDGESLLRVRSFTEYIMIICGHGERGTACVHPIDPQLRDRYEPDHT